MNMIEIMGGQPIAQQEPFLVGLQNAQYELITDLFTVANSIRESAKRINVLPPRGETESSPKDMTTVFGALSAQNERLRELYHELVEIKDHLQRLV